MTTAVATLRYDQGQFGLREYTAAASIQGKEFGRKLFSGFSGYSGFLQIDSALANTTAEEKLSMSLLQAKTAFRQLARSLSAEESQRLNTQLNEIFDPAEWPEGDALPSYGSAAALARTLMLVMRPGASLGVSQEGNLTASWRAGEEALSVEGYSDGSVTWAVARETDDEIIHISGIRTPPEELRHRLDERA